MTDPPLYLDTARAGLMAPGVQAALADLHRFAGREGLSARFGDLLVGGVEAWPAAFAADFPGLADWHGVGELKAAVRRHLGLPADHAVLLAARPTLLMRYAARRLARRCRRVLVTDLEWPAYVRLLEGEGREAGAEVVRVPVRDAAFAGAGADEIVAAVAAAYERYQCDGLFLAAVGHLGVRLPVGAVCRAAAAVRPPRCVVVDGSQAFAHTPDRPGPGCDIYPAGCHKWLGSHHPLGLAVCPHTPDAGDGVSDRADIDDPLLRLAERLGRRGEDGESETVGVAPLFAARAALARFEADEQEGGWGRLLANTAAVAAAADGTGWRPRTTDGTLRSGISILDAERPATRAAPADAVRRRFEGEGLVLTAYPGGRVRVSAPRRPLSGPELDRVRAALRACA